MREASTSRRRFLRAVGAGGLAVSATGVASAGRHPRKFRAHLTGDAQVPDPVDTNATEQAVIQLNGDGTELRYQLIVANIENVFMAHIHLAQAGENGPVAV